MKSGVDFVSVASCQSKSFQFWTYTQGHSMRLMEILFEIVFPQLVTFSIFTNSIKPTTYSLLKLLSVQIIIVTKYIYLFMCAYLVASFEYSKRTESLGCYGYQSNQYVPFFYKSREHLVHQQYKNTEII